MSGSVFEDDYRARARVGKNLNRVTYRRDLATSATVAFRGETLADSSTTITLFSRRNDHGQIPNYQIGICAAVARRGAKWNSRIDSLGLDVKHVQNFGWMNAHLNAGIYIDRTDTSAWPTAAVRSCALRRHWMPTAAQCCIATAGTSNRCLAS